MHVVLLAMTAPFHVRQACRVAAKAESRGAVVPGLLSELGRGLLAQMIPLWMWVAENAEGFLEARILYDSDNSSDTK